eukprot:4928933-Alexandrium_andersonii.AAC.1
MSASLVGSEMCIRDSSRPAAWPPRRPHAPPRRCNRGGRHREREGSSHGEACAVAQPAFRWGRRP